MADTNEKQKIEQLEAQLSATSNALAAEKARADAAETKLSTEKSRADAAEGEVGALKASVTQLRSERRDDSVLASKDAEIKAAVERADKAERALLAVPAQIEAGVKARVDLERAATSVMGPDFRMDGLSDREIMLTVLEKRGHAVDSDRNDSHIRGAFNVAVENWRVGEECLQRVAKESRIERSDSTGNAGALTARQAREQMIARNRGLVK